MMSGVMQFFNGGIKVRRLLVGIKNAITALSGGGQTGAPVIDGLAGVVTTVAAGNNSVLMPPWQNGRLALVWNQGANAMQLFSFESVAPAPLPNVTQFVGATGTKVAGTTGISVASGAFYLFVGGLDATGAYPVWNEAAFGTSAGVFNGTVGATTPNSGVFTTVTVEDNLTVDGFSQGSVSAAVATAGSSVTNATALTAETNVIATNSASTQGCILPPTATVGVGGKCYVINTVATAFNLYGAGSDTIDGTTGSTGITFGASFRAAFIVSAAGAWVSYGLSLKA